MIRVYTVSARPQSQMMHNAKRPTNDSEGMTPIMQAKTLYLEHHQNTLQAGLQAKWYVKQSHLYAVKSQRLKVPNRPAGEAVDRLTFGFQNRCRTA